VNVELLLDARVELAEGPIWDPVRRALTWVDLLGGRVNSLGMDGVPGRSLVIGRRVGSAVPTTDGAALVLATDAGFAQVDDEGNFQVVAEVTTDCPDWFMNDGKCDAHGRFWAGTIGVGDDGLAVPGAGSLYRLDPDGQATVARTGITLSNGMDWSPDGRTFYYIDSQVGAVDAFAFDLASGELGPSRRVVEIDVDPELGFADGMCVDADGGLWTAVWGTGEVRRYTPHGALDRTIQLPVTQPTSCIFAGDALDVLVITTAWHRLSPGDLGRQPHAGSLFCCRPGTTGRPTHTFDAIR
jgi:sugar lactone lactonase YvrE